MSSKTCKFCGKQPCVCTCEAEGCAEGAPLTNVMIGNRSARLCWDHTQLALEVYDLLLKDPVITSEQLSNSNADYTLEGVLSDLMPEKKPKPPTNIV